MPKRYRRGYSQKQNKPRGKKTIRAQFSISSQRRVSSASLCLLGVSPSVCEKIGGSLSCSRACLLSPQGWSGPGTVCGFRRLRTRSWDRALRVTRGFWEPEMRSAPQAPSCSSFTSPGCAALGPPLPREGSDRPTHASSPCSRGKKPVHPLVLGAASHPLTWRQSHSLPPSLPAAPAPSGEEPGPRSVYTASPLCDLARGHRLCFHSLPL